MEGRICFEYRWGLKPVLIYALCHTNPIFDLDYQNKLSKIPNNMSSRKRSNTYWSTNTFAPSVAICIARIICHRLSAAICIGRPICLCSSAAICIDRSICHRWRAAICIGQPICYPDSAAICIDYTNMPPSSIWFTIHIEIHIVLSKVCNLYQFVLSLRPYFMGFKFVSLQLKIGDYERPIWRKIFIFPCFMGLKIADLNHLDFDSIGSWRAVSGATSPIALWPQVVCRCG